MKTTIKERSKALSKIITFLFFFAGQILTPAKIQASTPLSDFPNNQLPEVSALDASTTPPEALHVAQIIDLTAGVSGLAPGWKVVAVLLQAFNDLDNDGFADPIKIGGHGLPVFKPFDQFLRVYTVNPEGAQGPLLLPEIHGIQNFRHSSKPGEDRWSFSTDSLTLPYPGDGAITRFSISVNNGSNGLDPSVKFGFSRLYDNGNTRVQEHASVQTYLGVNVRIQMDRQDFFMKTNRLGLSIPRLTHVASRTFKRTADTGDILGSTLRVSALPINGLSTLSFQTVDLDPNDNIISGRIAETTFACDNPLCEHVDVVSRRSTEITQGYITFASPSGRPTTAMNTNLGNFRFAPENGLQLEQIP